MALSRRAADQGIVHTLVQATNSRAVISLLIDFEVGSEKKFRRKLLDCETDRVRSVRKTSVPYWLSPRLPIAGGEKLRLGAVIKSDAFERRRGQCEARRGHKNGRYSSGKS